MKSRSKWRLYLEGTREWFRSALRKEPAGVISAALALVTVIFTVSQFNATQEREEQAKAVDLFIKYNELMQDTRSKALEARTADQKTGLAVDEKYPAPIPPRTKDDRLTPAEWQDNLAVSLAESIFLLRRNDCGWVETVRLMLKDQPNFFTRKAGIDCKTYNDDFVLLLNEAAGTKVCEPPPRARERCTS